MGDSVQGFGCLFIGRMLRVAVGGLFLTLQFSLAVAESSIQLNIDSDSITVPGYDLMSYFDARAEPVNEYFSSCYQGVTCLFNSAAHVPQFEATHSDSSSPMGAIVPTG